jgi:perosamine synthetase
LAKVAQLVRSRTSYSVGEPSIGSVEIARVMDSVSRGRLTQGPNVQHFESMLASFFEVQHVVACSSGTSALHLALAAIGIGPGDEVLVPDLSFVATANAVSYTGATPIFVDVNADDWNISLSDAARKVTERTKAILCVHLYGMPCEMGAMQQFADEHDIEIVEDAAEAFGGYAGVEHCGTIGLCGTFSFYANKIITTGEGGCVVTNNAELADTLRFLRGQAQSPTRRFWHSEIGFNYRMSDLHAAIGIAQMQRVHELLEKRAVIVQHYEERLSNVLKTQPAYKDAAPWLFTGLLPKGKSYSRVACQLEARAIEVRPIFEPMHRLPMYAQPEEDFPVSGKIADSGISLPTHPALTIGDVDYISDQLIEVLS